MKVTSISGIFKAIYHNDSYFEKEVVISCEFHFIIS